MRVACVQLASKLGDVSWNVRRVRELVSSIDGSLDLLVLPEMAVTGYNFRDRSHILPFCEDRHAIGSASPSLSLARELSHQFKGARVVVGFPEREDSTSQTKLYNSAAIVNEAGLQHIYRKHFLFDTDKRWATAGDAFGDVTIDDKRTALGICMDLNPFDFTAPWDAFEFGRHCVKIGAQMAVVPMAWLQSDGDQLSYWLARLGPALDHDLTLVFANRCGTEGDVTFAGRSAIVRVSAGEQTIDGARRVAHLLASLDDDEGVLVADV